jgi:Cytochrome P450
VGKDTTDRHHSTLMLAGHDTTATSITWALYELSKSRQLQSGVRREIRDARAQSSQRGDKGELSLADLESMNYLLAVVKVSVFAGDAKNTVMTSAYVGNTAVSPHFIARESRSGMR